MPCGDGGVEIRHVSMPEDRRQIALLTRLLCNSCTLLDAAGVELTPELYEWWVAHQKEDQERILEAKRRADQKEARERRDAYLQSVRTRVITQLTDDEREALGLSRRK